MEKKYAPLALTFHSMRDFLKITQVQLAESTGIKRPYISRFEAGESNVSIDFLMKMAQGLGCKLSITLTPEAGLPITAELIPPVVGMGEHPSYDEYPEK